MERRCRPALFEADECSGAGSRAESPDRSSVRAVDAAIAIQFLSHGWTHPGTDNRRNGFGLGLRGMTLTRALSGGLAACCGRLEVMNGEPEQLLA